MPWGETAELVLPPFDQLPLEENHRLACAAFDAGNYFVAHEAWETAWKQSRAAGSSDVALFKGLAQVGAGYTHLLRGNGGGAVALLRRGAARIERAQPREVGDDYSTVVARCRADADAIEMGQITPGSGPMLVPPMWTVG